MLIFFQRSKYFFGLNFSVRARHKMPLKLLINPVLIYKIIQSVVVLIKHIHCLALLYSEVIYLIYNAKLTPKNTLCPWSIVIEILSDRQWYNSNSHKFDIFMLLELEAFSVFLFLLMFKILGAITQVFLEFIFCLVYRFLYFLLSCNQLIPEHNTLCRLAHMII